MRSFLKVLFAIILIVFLILILLSFRTIPDKTIYGVTFSVPYAEEIGIDWKAAYRAMFTDLEVKHLRLIAYWDETEPERDRYDWSDLDFQISEARKHDADVILAVGRRLPRWPECHVPYWVGNMEWEEQQMEIKQLVQAVVERYRDDPAIAMWQVENEAFIPVFGNEQCGELGRDFVQEEIDLVHSLDGRLVLLTDGGNFGLWATPYQLADVFGTSMYLYFWRPDVGGFKTILPASYYRVKANVMHILFGTKPIILSELSLEPWLAAPIDEVPIDEQLKRMNVGKAEEILEYARRSSFGTQYLWGVEWWYWLKVKHNHPEFWDFAKDLFRQ